MCPFRAEDNMCFTGKQKVKGGGGGVRCCVTLWEGAGEGGVLASVTPSYEKEREAKCITVWLYRDL